MANFVTWQSRVTVDSICNSCDVFIDCCLYGWNQICPEKVLAFLEINMNSYLCEKGQKLVVCSLNTVKYTCRICADIYHLNICLIDILKDASKQTLPSRVTSVKARIRNIFQSIRIAQLSSLESLQNWSHCMFDHYRIQGSNEIKETSQELRMLSSVTLDCQVTKIVMNSGSQL